MCVRGVRRFVGLGRSTFLEAVEGTRWLCSFGGSRGVECRRLRQRLPMLLDIRTDHIAWIPSLLLSGDCILLPSFFRSRKQSGGRLFRGHTSATDRREVWHALARALSPNHLPLTLPPIYPLI